MASPPRGLQHGPEQKVRLELIFALDLFGSFSIKGKGTKNQPVKAKKLKNEKNDFFSFKLFIDFLWS